MPTVVVTSSLGDQFTGGLDSIEVAATNIRELILALDALFPGFGAYIERNVAIAIDGKIYQDAWMHPLLPESEVYLIQRISGGHVVCT